MPPPSSDDDDGWVAHVVFLCAEDDDLELVSLVHRAGEERIGVEVLPGVDRDAELVLDGLDGIERDACVLFCSKDYPPSDALGFRQRFQARYPDDELIVMEVDQSRVESHVGLLIRRLVLSRSTEVSGIQSIPDAPVESSAAAAASVESGFPEEDEPPPSRSRLPLLLGGLCLIGLLGLAAWQISSGQDASSGQSATAAVGVQVGPVGQTGAVPSGGARPEDATPNLLVLQETLGADNPALQDLPDEQVDAAVLVITAAQNDSPCVTLREGKAGLEHTNAALLALILAANVEMPDCGEEQAADEDLSSIAADDDAALGSEPADRSQKRGQRSRRSRRSHGKSRAANPQPEASGPEPKAAEPKVVEPEPKPPSTPKPRARLIDDGLIQTTE
ncbi:MAG: hypothetical protein KUG77_00380 [Nannocystaceae bacterium]|nr:hypothetical protein [Nannocystaceae bacterium]